MVILVTKSTFGTVISQTKCAILNKVLENVSFGGCVLLKNCDLKMLNQMQKGALLKMYNFKDKCDFNKHIAVFLKITILIAHLKSQTQTNAKLHPISSANDHSVPKCYEMSQGDLIN
jgi:hypothetical protein